VAKLADALDLGSSSREGVKVQVLSSAPQFSIAVCARDDTGFSDGVGAGRDGVIAMEPMGRPRRNLLIAITIGLLSDLWPIPGAILAAVVFREGIHSSAPTAYLVLAYILNFAMFAAPTYAIAANVSRQPRKATPKPTGPVKGIIYTESELEDFRRRGL
jgi:hypothetical protein